MPDFANMAQGANGMPDFSNMAGMGGMPDFANMAGASKQSVEEVD
jgi:hypothetical protein